MDNIAMVLAGVASIDAANGVQNISSLLYHHSYMHAFASMKTFRLIIPKIPSKILENLKRHLKTAVEEIYQDVGKRKIEEQKRQEQRKLGKTEEERTRLEDNKLKEASTAAKKETELFCNALCRVGEKASEEVAKELEAEDHVCNAEECTDVLRYQAAIAIADIIVEEMTDVITRVSVEGTDLMYKAKLGTYDPQNVAFKEFFPILKNFQKAVEYSFTTFSMAFYRTEGTRRDGKQMRSPFDDIGPKMVQKLSGLDAWLKNHENDRVQVDKSVSDTFCMIMEYIMQPFIAGMGTLRSLSEEVDMRRLNPQNFQCTVTQLNSIKRNLLKIMSTFESLEELVDNMTDLENTLPSSVDVQEWKARLELIT